MNTTSNGTGLTLMAVGDVFLDRPSSATAFDEVREIFGAGDVVFGNLEGAYARDWERAPSAGSPVVADPDHVPAFSGAGFTVMSLANNHILDGGHSAMLSTRDALQASGVATAGAGENLADARSPALLRRPGGTVAVLAYASVMPHGYEARAGTPGLAPLRAHTLYTPWEVNEWNPGLLPRVTTVTHEGDLAGLREDIARAKDRADVVVTSFHWGDFTRPYVLTDHERRVARAAVDAGSDVVLGHHHHLLRGIELYRGKPIFYGLGHFAFDLPNLAERLAADGYLSASDPAEARELGRRFGEYRIAPREGFPLLPFHPEARMTAIAVVRFADRNASEVGVVPCVLGPDNRPRPVDGDSGPGAEVVAYLRRCCEEEDLPVSIETGGVPSDGGYPVATVHPRTPLPEGV